MAVTMLLLSSVLGFMAMANGAQVTPMEKVITLLKDLSAKVEAEGKKEAVAYDKYACFCKDQADGKIYAIEKSDAKIKDLKAEIKELDTAIAELDDDISELSKKVSGLKKDINDKQEKRDKDHAKYLAKAQDMDEAIAACAAAIDALKDHKSQLKDAKTSGLLQTVATKKHLLAKDPSAVALLSKLDTTAAPKYQYQSNDIIATLEDLLAKFKEMKKDLDNDEFEVNSAFEKNRLALSNEQKFAEKERAEKEAIRASKDEQRETAKSDRDEETDDRNADQEFLDLLTEDCETKAKLFDVRSKARAGELTALSEATAELEKGAVPNFGANKKLVGLQKSVLLRKSSKTVAGPATFVQISSVQHQAEESGRQVVLQRVRSFLAEKADSMRSGVLSAITTRIQLAEDHFVKVRGLINDLITKLENDAKDEAEQKGVCDTGMKKALTKRDKAKARIELANGKITTLTSNKDAMNDEIEDLDQQISNLKKALLEATELRADNKADNEKTIEMSEEGAESVKLALGILKKFYDNAFVQLGSKKYVPPKSDREGNTLADLAPEYNTEDYHGSQAESGGIIGILEVIFSDFERNDKVTTDNEDTDEKEFKKFEKETNADVDKKDNRIKKLEGKVKKAESDILEQEQELSDAKDLLDAGESMLEDLHDMCVKGEETWEERKQKREEEIEALKNALAILEDWQA